MVLYIDRFWISPYSFSTYVALLEKQLSFRVIEIALDQQQQKSSAYLEVSFTGRVPTFVDGKIHLSESSAIAEFLEDSYPDKKLFPEKIEDRAYARMIMAWLRSDFTLLRAELPSHTMFYEKAMDSLSDGALSETRKLLTFCDRFIGKNHDHQLFTNWCLADAEISFMLHRLILNEHKLPPKIVEYAEANWSRHSVEQFVKRSRPNYVPY
jgi:glutathione S-transferase